MSTLFTIAILSLHVATASVLPHQRNTTPPAALPPNFLVILADDLGWYDTSLTNANAPTPSIKRLSEQGIVLSHHYVFRYCSPTRRSLLSGRFPNHLTTVQPDGKNLCSDVLPLNISILSEKLSTKYDSYFIGKGHLGYQTEDHLPINRQFKQHVGFLAGSESYKYGGGASNATLGAHDLWHNHRPAYDIVPTLTYATNYYTSQAIAIIHRHSKLNTPFFMYFAIQNVHSPYQLPPLYEQHEYPLMWNRTYANMLHILDASTHNLTNALVDTGLWNQTLILWTSDNGGIGLGNNYPLRGHKHDPYEGGTRAIAFLSGGFLPTHVRGTTTNVLIHVSDWYPTFCHLAKMGDCTDPAYFVKDDAIHDIDGVNVWPMLTGENMTQPRALTPTSEVGIIDVSNPQKWWKLITLAGQSVYYEKNQTTHNGTNICLDRRQPDPPQPGRTDALVSGCPVCNATQPCLFDILNDPNEEINQAEAFPHVVSVLQQSVLRFQQSYVTGRLTKYELETYYNKIDNVDAHWEGYLGPCYLSKERQKYNYRTE